jgi:endonuclease/exonuclease/phosphatase family metal-dependent hydrolase
VLVSLIAVAAPSAHAAGTPTIGVMTRNLYLGADLLPLATTPPGPSFEQTASSVFANLRTDDPNARMQLVAQEIAQSKPDLVGLQEVALWRTGPAPASHVAFDYLTTIRAALTRLHQPYHVVAIKQGLDVEGPMGAGTDVRVTLADAILARKDVSVSRAHSARFANQLTIPTQAIGPVPVNRTYNALDATVHGVRVHVVNTHLEAYATAERLDQANELVAGPLQSKLPTILLGDLNSGPDLPKAADRPPYLAITQAGFQEARTTEFSCCYRTLSDGSGWDHNVDHIMTKPTLPLARSYLTGTETTEAGRHPADHGGVVSEFRLTRTFRG